MEGILRHGLSIYLSRFFDSSTRVALRTPCHWCSLMYRVDESSRCGFDIGLNLGPTSWTRTVSVLWQGSADLLVNFAHGRSQHFFC